MENRKISIGQYNGLYHSAENGLQKSWHNMGMTHEEVNKRADANEDLNNCDVLPNSYFLYKASCNEIVDEILEQLGIEVDENL